MKKLALALVAILLVMTMTTSLAEGYVIANTPKCIGIAWWDRMETGNQRFEAATGNEVYQDGPAGGSDEAQQLAAVQNAHAAFVDAITVIPSAPESLENELAACMNDGIIVISHEAETLKNVHYDLEAFDNTAYGAHMMDVLAAEMGEEGDYTIMVGALTMVSHMQWAEGAVARQKEAYPKMNLVCDYLDASAYGGSNEGSYLAAKEALAKYPTLKGVIGCDMINPPGIAQAVEEAGKAGEIAVTGTCLVSVAGEYLTSGTIKTIVFWDPADAGEAMCNLAVMVKEGVAIENGINLNVPGYESCSVDGKIVRGAAWVDVTAANAADYPF